jgi:hypothetical protein
VLLDLRDFRGGRSRLAVQIDLLYHTWCDCTYICVEGLVSILSLALLFFKGGIVTDISNQ